MKKLLLIICITFVGYQPDIVGDDMPFGMFIVRDHIVPANLDDDAPFCVFDTAHARELQAIEDQIIKLEQQQLLIKQTEQLDELLQQRTEKKVQRSQYLAQMSSGAGYVCYKLRNRERVNKSVPSAEPQQEISTIPETPTLAQDRSYQVVQDNLEPREFAYKKKDRKDPQVVARCDIVREYTKKYLEVAQQITDMQTDMVDSLRADLEHFRALAQKRSGQGSKPNAYPADLRRAQQ